MRQKIKRAKRAHAILGGLLAIVDWADSIPDDQHSYIKTYADQTADSALELYHELVRHGALPQPAKPPPRELSRAELAGLVGQTVRTVTARGDDFQGVVQKVSTLAVFLQGANGASKVFPLTNGFFRA